MENQNKKTYKLGVTGGIACGKTLVRNILDGLGIPTLDADEIVHDLLQNDKTVISQIIDLFGTTTLNETGGINRKNLAKLVFIDQQRLHQLESIIHPHTYRVINDYIANSHSDIVAVIIPLLFENNRQNLFDSVWLVTSEEEQQISRLKLRDEMSEEEALQRIHSQMPQHLKMTLADKVIDNSGSIEDLQKQVNDGVKEIRAKF